MKNGKKFKTVKERNEAFREWCKHSFESGCKEDYITCSECQFAWLDLEAEEEKPLPCPYCGKDVEVRTMGDYDTWNQVQCTCGYRSSWWSIKAEAIASHNRVARAVMESGKEGER